MSEQSSCGDGLLDWAGEAVRGILCEIKGCDAQPVADRNGRKLCAKHRDHYDNARMGRPCDRCESKQWVETPDAASVAVCAICDYVTYDESVFDHSWASRTAENPTNGGDGT